MKPEASTDAGAGEARFWEAVDFASRFHIGDSRLQRALERWVATLEELKVPYAVVGALALAEYGYLRATSDIGVLLSSEGLERVKAHVLGRGYLERFPGSRGLRDTENKVDIDVVLAGHYPGDGKPKPVRFPDPAVAARRGARVSLLPLPRLIELKLASGLSAPHRLRDLADVLELVRVARLPLDLGDELDPSVRDKYRELWHAAQGSDPE
jgi:hypothetical protein